mmetsp:Transcript_36778/g.89072  ORF Transcript_36778/g.89072 Transcript_36778/m.89072 type:complete len:93 (-) Transcript_36778:1124-1402(-)
MSHKSSSRLCRTTKRQDETNQHSLPSYIQSVLMRTNDRSSFSFLIHTLLLFLLDHLNVIEIVVRSGSKDVVDIVITIVSVVILGDGLLSLIM